MTLSLLLLPLLILPHLLARVLRPSRRSPLSGVGSPSLVTLLRSAPRRSSIACGLSFLLQVVAIDVSPSTAYHRLELRVMPITAELLLHSVTVVEVRVFSGCVVRARSRPMSASTLLARWDDREPGFPLFGHLSPLAIFAPQPSSCLSRVAQSIGRLVRVVLRLIFVFNSGDRALDSLVIALVAARMVTGIMLFSVRTTP